MHKIGYILHQTSELLSPSSKGAVIRVSSRVITTGGSTSSSGMLIFLSKARGFTSKLTDNLFGGFSLVRGVSKLLLILGMRKVLRSSGSKMTVCLSIDVEGVDASKLMVGWW